MAVGSQSHVTLLDAREKGAVQYVGILKANSVRHPRPARLHTKQRLLLPG